PRTAGATVGTAETRTPAQSAAIEAALAAAQGGTAPAPAPADRGATAPATGGDALAEALNAIPGLN
ncbi:hypothetical protein IX55_15730, partial [Paracoccus sanguinis]